MRQFPRFDAASYIVWIVTSLFAAPLLAVPLAPGGFANLTGTSYDLRPELGGVVLEDEIRPFSADSGGGNFTGTIQDRVVRSTLSGTLDFYYFINVDVSSAGAVDFVTRTNYTGFSTDVDWRSDPAGTTSPDQASRNAGNQVLFDFFADNLLGPGQTSSFFFIKTAATSYNELGAGALAISSPIGAATFNFNTFQPITTAPAPVRWNVNASGSWTVGTNWNPTAAPNAIAATANFGSIITSARIVTLNAAQMIGTANFDSAFAYTLAGSNTLTFDAGGPSGINVTAGSHVISAPIVLNSDLTVNSGTNSGVALTGNLTATGRNITKAGAGTAQFENVRALTLNVNGGIAKISQKGTANSSAGTSKVTSLAISAGAKLDLTNNSAIIDYTTLGTTLSDLRGHLKAGRLFTSTASPANTRLGYNDNASLPVPKTTFAGQSVDTTSVLIKFTYSGDSDLDGDADGVDIGKWATNFTGELGGGAGATRTWAQGDWDYDGDVDGVDAGLWATAFTGELGGSGLASALIDSPINAAASAILAGMGITVVPEPAMEGFLALGLAIAALRRRNSVSRQTRREVWVCVEESAF